MQKSKKGTQKTTDIPSCVTGVLAGVVISAVFISFGALFILNEYIGFENLGIVAAAIQFLSVTSACIVAGSITAEHQFLCCGATGIIYYLTFMGTAMLFLDGVSSTAITGIITTALGVAGSIFVVIGKKNRSVRKRIKKRSR